jgi:hypothetical protein
MQEVEFGTGPNTLFRGESANLSRIMKKIKITFSRFFHELRQGKGFGTKHFKSAMVVKVTQTSKARGEKNHAH